MKKDVQEEKVSEFIRLFQYIEEVSSLIGRDRSLQILEELVLKKRLEWFDKNREKLKVSGDPIDQAFNLFYRDYLKLASDDGEVVERTEDKLVTRWWNFCPVLEACKTLNMDTREICKRCYEKPVQIFIKKIHPKLTFKRNYRKIRPYSAFCEETIEMER